MGTARLRSVRLSRRMKRITDATCENNRNKVEPRASDAEAYLQCLKLSKQKLFAQVMMLSWPMSTMVNHFRKNHYAVLPHRVS
jgi:hypothetical protein